MVTIAPLALSRVAVDRVGGDCVHDARGLRRGQEDAHRSEPLGRFDDALVEHRRGAQGDRHRGRHRHHEQRTRALRGVRLRPAPRRLVSGARSRGPVPDPDQRLSALRGVLPLQHQRELPRERERQVHPRRHQPGGSRQPQAVPDRARLAAAPVQLGVRTGNVGAERFARAPAVGALRAAPHLGHVPGRGFSQRRAAHRPRADHQRLRADRGERDAGGHPSAVCSIGL